MLADFVKLALDRGSYSHPDVVEYVNARNEDQDFVRRVEGLKYLSGVLKEASPEEVFVFAMQFGPEALSCVAMLEKIQP